MSVKEIERFLYNECGLKGLSGISNDVRELLESKDPRAKLALDHFVYRISLYGGDARGGDGWYRRARLHGRHRRERTSHSRGRGHAPNLARSRLRSRCKRLQQDADLAPRSRVACYVIPTDEELMIARHTLAVLRAQCHRS